VEVPGFDDGAVGFETAYTDSDGANAKIEEMWGKSEFYYFTVGCFPSEKKSNRLRGQFGLQPAAVDSSAAYSTGVFGDASDIYLTIGPSKIDPGLKNFTAYSQDDNPPFSILELRPEKYGETHEFSEILMSGQIDLSTQGKVLHFAWPVESGIRVIDALVAAGCKV
jgi:hypothetical protein